MEATELAADDLAPEALDAALDKADDTDEPTDFVALAMAEVALLYLEPTAEVALLYLDAADPVAFIAPVMVGVVMADWAATMAGRMKSVKRMLKDLFQQLDSAYISRR